MGKNRKNTPADLAADLEKALRKLAGQVDKKLEKFQDAISSLRVALREMQIKGDPPPPPPRKKAPKLRGDPPPPPPRRTGTALRGDPPPPPPRKTAAAASGDPSPSATRRVTRKPLPAKKPPR